MLFFIKKKKKKIGTNFLTSTIGILYKSVIVIWYSGSISLLISILSGVKGYNLYVIIENLQDIHNPLWEHIFWTIASIFI